MRMQKERKGSRRIRLHSTNFDLVAELLVSSMSVGNQTQGDCAKPDVETETSKRPGLEGASPTFA